VALSATGDPALSEEIAQEAFVTAWTELSNLREPEKFSAWLCGIVRNLARYARRHQRRHALGSPELEDPGHHLARAACPGPSPLEQAISREQHGMLRDALGTIPEAYRVPLILFYSERKSLEQVARCLDLSEQTVKQRLCRGRKYLKQSVEQRLARAVAASAPRAGLGVAVLAAISLSGRRASAATAWTASLPASPRPWLGLAARSSALAMSAALAVTAIVLTGQPAPAGMPPAQAHEIIATPQKIVRESAIAQQEHDPLALRVSGTVLMGPVEIIPALPRATGTTAHTTERMGEVAQVVRARRDWRHRTRTPIVPTVIEHGPSAVTPATARPGPSLSWHDALDALPPPSHRAARSGPHGSGLPIRPPDLRDRIQTPDL
jgi:RNA polymerase sigma factor (sigma-70 family)